MTRFLVTFSRAEAEALARVSYSEMRDPREQIRFVIRGDLMRRGLLPAEATTPGTQAAEGVRDDATA
ncbi:MAG: hypothetical protein HZB53_20060 [Chloroflexi bacterium]|nr:hypothetical protein [Chloroflexota bacterium]